MAYFAFFPDEFNLPGRAFIGHLLFRERNPHSNRYPRPRILAEITTCECQQMKRNPMIICDLCGETKNCLQKEIEGKEYDICSECWTPLAEKLKGKGRLKNLETVCLPPPRHVKEREDEEPKSLPGEPPKIWGEGHRVH
jgi:hypothetical protein